MESNRPSKLSYAPGARFGPTHLDFFVYTYLSFRMFPISMIYLDTLLTIWVECDFVLGAIKGLKLRFLCVGFLH
ncbi:hypothetical protein OROMI_004993 [Orobanche minor]